MKLFKCDVFIFFMDEVSSGGIVLNEGGLVLVYQRNGMCGFPKGHVESGESVEETARREIYEETGIRDLVLVKKLGEYIRGVKGNLDLKKSITMFLFRTSQEELVPVDSGIIKAEWVLFDEVANELSYDGDLDFFLKVRSKLE